MLYSIVLAGGSGTRLWPLSRAGSPKFLHTLTGTDLTLLQTTVERLKELSPADQVYVVTGVSHVAAVSRQLPSVPAANILVEPAPRDSCAAIALAAAVIAARDPEATIGVFSSDHLIGDESRFVDTIQKAQSMAAAGYLMTVGVRPTRPEVGFGYLKIGEDILDGGHLVSEFKEKPSSHAALDYLNSGEYLWNAGMLVFKVQTFLDQLKSQKPALHAGITRIAAAWGLADWDVVLSETWPSLEKISVDYAVMEGAAAVGAVATVPADFAWSDIGDFHSLGESLACDDAGNLVLGENAGTVLRDVKSSVVVSRTDRVIAVTGVEDLVIVDTEDALLVCPRARAHEVKQIVDELRARGLEQHI